MKRFLYLIIVLISGYVSAYSAPPEESVNTFLKQGGLSAANTAVKIIDLKDGAIIASHNEDMPLIPASIMKSVTTAALLGEVGPNWRYHTRVYIDGPVDMGILRGNLILEGACDPSLNSESEPYSNDILEEITEMLKYMYITRIEGSIIIDENAFSGPPRPASWAQGDFKKYYGTGSHAFNYSNNARGDFSVEDPKGVFVKELKSRLAAEGIEVDEKFFNDGQRTQIFDHTSAPLDEIMRSCMMRSDNMFAESMLRTYGKLLGADGSTDMGATLERELWENKGMPLEGVVIVDGSGLSRQNRVTANFMGAILQHMSDNPDYASFFPLAGQEGTLKKFLAGSELDSYIAMKTGSMNGIQCYAGYKLDDDYAPTHVVVIIMNGLTKNRDRAKKAAEKMLLEIFDNSETTKQNG